MVTIEKTYTTVNRLSRQIGIPAKWLKTEAEAGRIPSLVVGRRRFFNRATVEIALAETAQKAAVAHA
jgi:hypothetical protein